MAQAYLTARMHDTAVFEAYFRSLPPSRAYVVVAGISAVLDYLETFRFERDEIAYLRGLGGFGEAFLEWLPGARFTGDVWAMPEGTAAFPNEPLVQIVAPIVEAQLVETFVLNQVCLHSMLATKASRVVEAARGRPVVDFGSRRAQGIDAALAVARSSYMVGAAGTSNLLAGHRFEIPVFGTMAHSFVQAFEDEIAAFESFVKLYPSTTLLVDTYDTLDGVDRVIALARRLGQKFGVHAVRLDSGDAEQLSIESRQRLDAAGLGAVEIFVSSGLDEYSIARLVSRGAPIDAFGVGTKMAVSADAPDLDMAYKLVEYAGVGRTKLAPAKQILPGRKQVFREIVGGHMKSDVIAAADERCAGEPLLVPVMREGRRLDTASGLTRARRRWQQQRGLLPDGLRSIVRPAEAYPVRVTERLVRDLRHLSNRLGSTC